MTTNFYPGLSLRWDDDDWEASGPEEDPTARLTLNPHLSICGVSMHCEAYAVSLQPQTSDAVGVYQEQVADHAWGADALDAIDKMDEGDGPRSTAKITVDGRTREYIIVTYPYSD